MSELYDVEHPPMHDRGSAPEPRPLGWVVVGEAGPNRWVHRGRIYDTRAEAEKALTKVAFGHNNRVEPVGAPPREPGEVVERGRFDDRAFERTMALHRLSNLVEEIRIAHRDSGDAAYNECDRDECAWCSGAREALAVLALPPSSPQSEPREQEGR